MSVGTIFSIAFTLAIVLGVMGIALRLLRKYTMGAQVQKNGGVNMEVVQRLTIGQRQGIAVVRIGSRVLAVSMGDGGVHPIAELNPNDIETKQGSEDNGDVLNLRGLTTSLMNSENRRNRNANAKRMSYVAPLEDFNAVLDMAMREPLVAAHR